MFQTEKISLSLLHKHLVEDGDWSKKVHHDPTDFKGFTPREALKDGNSEVFYSFTPLWKELWFRII